MKQCPLCHAAVEPTQNECAQCGEALVTWRTVETAAGRIHQRGLRQAAAADYLGATISCLISAMANPLGTDAWLDTARGLIHLGRRDDAARLLHTVQRRAPQSGASDLIAALQQDSDPPPPAAAVVVAVAEDAQVPAAPPNDSASQPVDPRSLLGLPPIARKRSWLQKRGAGTLDGLWTSVLTTESQHRQTPLGETAWWQSLAKGPAPHSAILYWLGLAAWQCRDASAAGWFQKSLEAGAPVLNPLAYLIAGSAHDATLLRQWNNRFREMGLAAEQIQEVLRVMRDSAAANGYLTDHASLASCFDR